MNKETTWEIIEHGYKLIKLATKNKKVREKVMDQLKKDLKDFLKLKTLHITVLIAIIVIWIVKKIIVKIYNWKNKQEREDMDLSRYRLSTDYRRYRTDYG